MSPRRVLAVAALLLATPAAAAAADALWTLLRSGGQVVLMRHGLTTPGVGDPPGFLLDDCATQRNLIEAGREESRRVGAAFRARGIPIGRVLSSPWCRCVETAQLAFGRAELWRALDNLYGRREREHDQMQALREVVSRRPDAGNLLWTRLPVATTAVTAVVVAVGTASIIGIARHAAAVDADDRFLAAWLVIQVVFGLATWSLAVRYLLAALPPLALLVTRAVTRSGVVRKPGWVLGGVTIVTLALGVAVLRADTFWVDQYREAATWAGATARARGQQAFFKPGGWGFHYYALRSGMRSLDQNDAGRPGDLVFFVRDAPAEPFTQTEIARMEHLGNFWSPPPPLRLHTMNPSVGAGFHASVFGPLPMMISDRPAVLIIVWRIRP